MATTATMQRTPMRRSSRRCGESFFTRWTVDKAAFDSSSASASHAKTLLEQTNANSRSFCWPACQTRLPADSRCSSRVSSLLLWLLPPTDCTNIITVGIPARETSAASMQRAKRKACGAWFGRLRGSLDRINREARGQTRWARCSICATIRRYSALRESKTLAGFARLPRNIVARAVGSRSR